MSLRVSTTGSDVVLVDLGITVTHPTTNRDLSLEFTSIELRDSDDLTQAIQNGNLTVDDGTFGIHQDDYDPDQLLIEELAFWQDLNVISHDELASKNDIEIVSGYFPLSLSSTAQSTRNVYAIGGRWKTWWLHDDDIVEITGCPAAGLYTVESVTDQQNFIVKEAIVDSTGGQVTIYHPGGATKVGIDDSTLNNLSGDTVQEVLEDIDSRFSASGFEDVRAKVSSNDTTSDYLEEKLTAGSGITLTTLNEGGDEQIEISATGLVDFNKLVLDCDGSLIYVGKGDIVICENPSPNPITGMDC